MNKDMQLYYDYTVSPLGQVFYHTAWEQLQGISNKKVLDFGSGFAFTSHFLAPNNTVVALEQDASMIAAALKAEGFEQIHGDLTNLEAMPPASFDVVLCHMVLEFVDNAPQIVQSLLRVLKKGGLLSIIRHNRAGRLMQAIIQEADFNEAHALMDGGHAYSSAFGDIKYYENEDILRWAKTNNTEEPLSIESVQGIRAIASLHSRAVQGQEDWVENMLTLERRLLKDPAFVNIAYFNHVFLRKH